MSCIDQCFSDLQTAISEAADTYRTTAANCTTTQCLQNAATAFSEAARIAGESFANCCAGCQDPPLAFPFGE